LYPTCAAWACPPIRIPAIRRRVRLPIIAGVMDALKVQKAALVTHDIGNMVGYALAVQYPARITRWAVIDAPLPGIGDWDNIIRSPDAVATSTFAGPMRSVWCRTRADLSRPLLERVVRRIRNGSMRRRASTTRVCTRGRTPFTTHFEQFGAFNQDAIDNKALLAKSGKITMPVLAIGAEKSFGYERRRMTCVSSPAMSPAPSSPTPATGSWKKSSGDHQARHGVPSQMKARVTAWLGLLVAVASALLTLRKPNRIRYSFTSAETPRSAMPDEGYSTLLAAVADIAA